MPVPTVSETKLHEFMLKAIGDIGAAFSAGLILLGDKLGLYKAMAQRGAVSPHELARTTGTHERYVREWLNNQAAGGYVTYDAMTGQYSLSPEQASALADENSPYFIPGAFQVAVAMAKAESRMERNFRTGEGLDWREQDPALFEGTERFFRANYLGNLIHQWIPALEGVEAKLEAGAKVADVGCGHGASVILMAQSYAHSTFFGYDYHPASIEVARQRAQAAGVADRVRFEVADATSYPEQDFDLVAHFDCLHDMSDPLGAARRVYETLKRDGTWMIVEPFAGDRVEDNLNPVGRVYYAASTMVCVPCSVAAHGPALGAQAGEARIRDLATQAGFTRFRRAAETPLNIVYEARR